MSESIEKLAWNCAEWPEWLKDIVDKTNAVADRLNMSAEQAYAYTALSAAARVREEAHPDDAAVDRFAASMKAKLKWEREERGRHGWNDPEVCNEEYLARLLIEHLAKGNDGNFEDVANFCMMLHQRGAHPRVLAEAFHAARVREEAEPSGWQPIETALKNGTEVLLFDPANDPPVFTGSWIVDGWSATAAGRYEPPRDSFESDDKAPTHWMSLPAPPRQAVAMRKLTEEQPSGAVKMKAGPVAHRIADMLAIAGEPVPNRDILHDIIAQILSTLTGKPEQEDNLHDQTLEYVARIIDILGSEMQKENRYLKPEGVLQLAAALRALKGKNDV